MEMNINEIERLFLLEDIVKITKTQADIDNYQRNIEVIHQSINYLNERTNYNEPEVENCINETYNYYKGSLPQIIKLVYKKYVMYPISKEETYENKVNILRFITENIPLYVCLREGLKDELKYCYFDFTGKELTDEMINKYI